MPPPNLAATTCPSRIEAPRCRSGASRTAISASLTPWVPRLQIERIACARHWVRAEIPGRVNGLRRDFLRGFSPGFCQPRNVAFTRSWVFRADRKRYL